jgi:hypothetical protein
MTSYCPLDHVRGVSENLAVAYSPYTTLNTFPSAVSLSYICLISLKILDFPYNVCGLDCEQIYNHGRIADELTLLNIQKEDG